MNSRREISPDLSRQEVRVFVLLGYGFGADRWRQQHARGEIPGLNEHLPYGYYHAAGDGWSIRYSQDADEGRIGRFLRRGLGRVLGFDLIHAWRNRKGMFGADVVWTHTEREHLAAILLRHLVRRGRGPRIVAECMWLPDRWAGFLPAKRALYRWLLGQADAITCQSEEGVSWLRALLPGATVECNPCGAVTELMRPPSRRPVHSPLRLAALGGDMHRDWWTLFTAFAGFPEFELRVASGKAKKQLCDRTTNVTVAEAKTEAEVRELYEWADLVVVALRPNLHVSGRTVIFEAIVLGVPVVSTDVGGLRAYFSDDELCYVPAGDPDALRAAARKLAADGRRRFAMAAEAQRSVLRAGLTTQGYADRFRSLSCRLLSVRALTKAAQRGAAGAPAPDNVRVFALLGYGFGGDRWRERFAKGEIPGLNDALPYGLRRAEGNGLSVAYSQDADEGAVLRLARRSVARVLGFDLAHAWRNRRSMLAADVVWAFTERESLAALLLFRLLGRRPRPRIVAQCMWLFDQWDRFSWPRRAAYRWLLGQADAIATLAPSNRDAACRLVPEVRSELVLFGLASSRSLASPRRATCHAPIRIAALGGDMHRDWPTLLAAFGGAAEFELRVLSAKIKVPKGEEFANVEARRARDQADVEGLYAWGDIVVVPLSPNLYASGSTVILEAVAFGVPVVASDAGGLRAYFSDDEICYVPPGDPDALREAARELAGDPERRFNMAAAAQRRMVEADLTWDGYAMRCRRLSEELLGRRSVAEARAVMSAPA